jgi:S-adenosylmethionine:tRNA ribosyltransferase-isomerase
MLVKDFNYHLPQELIARYPAPERDASRLMLLDRGSKTIGEDIFAHLGCHLLPGDLLVMNDTRVIPARLFGVKETGGGVELFLVKRLPGDGYEWECLLRGSKRFREGQSILFGSGMTAKVIGREGPELWRVVFSGEEPLRGVA